MLKRLSIVLLLLTALQISELPGMTPTYQESQVLLQDAKLPWFILGVVIGMTITL